MQSVSELYHIRSKSCYSTHRPRTSHSSQGTVKCDVRNSDSCSRLGSIGDHTIEIHQENVVNIDLPPLMWFGYNKTPKILSATNTGRTILLNGQWACGRPYVSGGPLNGSYIFSQIHFHSPSEHEIDGRRYPLEMHVVHYKNSYLTQERAMKEKDGTVVLVYLFQLVEHGTTIVSQISKFASCLEKKSARRELCKIPLDQFAPPFNSNYYTYRSSVPKDKNFYLLQWIISCNNLCVTRQEVEELLFVMNSSESVGRITPMQPENGVVFRVGEEDYCDWLISSQTTENPCCQQKKVKSQTSICEKPSKKSVCEEPCKKPLCEKPSKKFVKKKSSKKSVCEKPSKTSVSKKCSKKCPKKSSKTCVNKKSSKTSVSKKSSKTSASKKSSKTCVNKKSSKTCVNKKSSKTSVSKQSSKTSVSKTSSDKSVCVNSNTSVRKESSSTSAGESSSETSCTVVKETKVKKGKKCKSVKVDTATNTTPCCSKSDIKEKKKKKKEKKPKDVRVVKEQSKSMLMEKCSSKSGTSQTNMKKATSCASKESAGEKKTKKKSAESKSRKAKTKNSGEISEKCAETEASKTVEKSDCPDTKCKMPFFSTEKIKTIYQKKQKAPSPPPREGDAECSNTAEIIECSTIGDNIKNDEVACEDVQVNYLFLPSASSSVNSNLENVESDTAIKKNKEILSDKGSLIESKDFPKPPPHPTVNCALVKSIKFPVVKSGETKHVYLHSKHIFRTEGDNKGLTPRNFQECHLLIERDHYVLQEYSGKLYPDELSPGNYAQVNLLTRYPDPEDLKIHATECIAKLESQNELSIRAKFLILEANSVSGKESETFSTRKKSNESIQKKKSFYDAQCQCEQPKSTSVAIDTKGFEEELNTCKSLVKWDLENMRLQRLDVKNTELANVQNQNLRVGNEVDSRTKNEEKNLNKALVKRNCAIKLLKNLNTSGPESETNSKDSLEQKNGRENGKAVYDKISIKSTKNSLDERKKTTFFVYDRVEKDENSGKKIFVGSFRTRDEVEVLYKHKNIFQSDRISSDFSDVQSNSIPSVIGGTKFHEDASEKSQKSEDSRAVIKESTSKDENSVKNSETKQIITLHKFRPKNYHLRTGKKKSKSIIVGKISSKVDADSEKYSQLANMLGLDKAQRPKISFYEFQETDTRNATNVILGSNSEFDATTVKRVENSKEIDKDKVFSSISNRSESLDGEYGECSEGTGSLGKSLKSLDKKDSQTAIVILPIQVESLSKVEIVLIEHADDVKKAKVENKYTSYLKRYKRLILKLKSSFL